MHPNPDFFQEDEEPQGMDAITTIVQVALQLEADGVSGCEVVGALEVAKKVILDKSISLKLISEDEM